LELCGEVQTNIAGNVKSFVWYFVYIFFKFSVYTLIILCVLKNMGAFL